LLAGENESTVGLVLPPEGAPVGVQVLGVKGAPTLPFSEFQKYKFRIGPSGNVRFRGRQDEVDSILAVDGAALRVDKGLAEGTPVH